MIQTDWTPFALIPLGASVLYSGLALFVYSRRRGMVGPLFVWLVVALAVWQGFEALSMLVPWTPAKVFFAKLKHLGVQATAPLIMMIALSTFWGRAEIGLRLRALLFVPPVIALIGLWTTELHGLFWSDYRIEEIHGAHIFHADWGPLFWAVTIYSQGSVALALGVLAWGLLAGRIRFKRTTLHLIPVAAIPTISSIAYVAGVIPGDGLIDPTPLALGISAVFLIFGVLRVSSSAVVSVAHAEIVHRLVDPIVVVGSSGELISFNLAAREVLGVDDSLVGAPYALALAHLPDVVATLEESPSEPTEIQVAHPHRPRASDWFELVLTPLYDVFSNQQCTILVLRDITRYKAAERKIRALAYYDSLTGLPNRERFHWILSRTLENSRGGANELALLFLDLDRFKEVNDTLGHVAGDVLLSEVARRLVDCLRRSDWVAYQGEERGEEDEENVSRLGGDEFTVLLTHLRSPIDAATVARRIVDSLSLPFEIDGHEVLSGVSIGIAIHPNDGADVETLVRNADTAMYEAKRKGSNEFVFYDESMNSKGARRLALEGRLRKALGRDQLILTYQPLRDAESSRVLGAEVLLRWLLPDEGVVGPSEFIPIAEDTGLIHDIGDWVLEEACAQGARWVAQGYRPIRIAVNISSHQLRKAGFVEKIERVLERTGFSAERLELELTESSIMGEDDGTLSALAGLEDMGISFALDDFGTGYSSLSYLRRVKLSRVKVDRSFVRDLVTDENDRALAAAIIAMAKQLGLKVVAEGVESEAQLEMLRAMKCEELQGYLIGKPVPAELFVPFLESEKKESR